MSMIFAIPTKGTRQRKSNDNGFTLLELMVYVSIMAAVLLIVGSFMVLVIQSRIRQQTIAEVEGEGAQVLQYFTQNVRNSDSIASPLTGVTSQTLSVNGTVPMVLSLSDGTLQATQSGSSATLTSSKVAVSNVQFTNTASVTTPGSVKMQFTLTFVNPRNRNEDRYSQTFYGSATVR